MKQLFTISLLFFFSAHLNLKAQSDSDYSWNTPAGGYNDPSSFFALHGFMNGVFAGPSSEWQIGDPSALGAPGQLFIPNTRKSSFNYDGALVFSSELSSKASLLIETHLVNDPSGTGQTGPAGFTFVLTEAAVSYKIAGDKLQLSAGIFWAPFGIVNTDWLSAENLFTTVPRAAGAFPLHYNEKGIRLNGAFVIGENAGLNYVFSVGNGTDSFDITGLNSFDNNSDKTTIARVGVFPGLGKALEVGISMANGVLGADNTPNKRDFFAFGLDAKYQANNIGFRSYFITSTEDRFGNLPDDVNRNGFMAEAKYRIESAEPIAGMGALIPKVRFDYFKRDYFNAASPNSLPEASASTVSLGFNVVPFENVTFNNLLFGVEYHIISEGDDSPNLDNNRIVLRMTARF